jgi:hypothetical protein
VDGAPDLKQPSAARIYDYLLGGTASFAADRALAEHLMAAPGGAGLRELAAENRRFVLEAVRWLAVFKGTGQWLDLGCGLWGAGPSVHEAARRTHPEARVVYADRDPVAYCHLGPVVRAAGEGVTAVQADIRDPDAVLGGAVLDGIIDLAEPAGVIFGGVLSAMTAGEARETVKAWAGRLAPGSAAVISCAHFTDPEISATMSRMLGQAGGWHDHPPEDVASFFGAAGLGLVHGRIMDLKWWSLFTELGRPAAMIGGVGIKS